MKIRVMTVVGTRPELIRLSVLIPKLDRFFDHKLVHTGQNYDFELNQVFFEDLGLRAPDVFLDAAGDGYAQTIARVIERGSKVIRELRPQALLVLGDTNSALVAIVAKREHIPVFHMEAGNRGFNDEVPEEINRRIVDHIADINLPYTAIAREYLLREGLHPQRVVCSGSPMAEVIQHYRSRIEQSTVCQRLNLQPQEYFVLSAHREENVDSVDRLEALKDLLELLSERYKLPIVFSIHPRTRARLTTFKIDLPPSVKLFPPFGFIDYMKLQLCSKAVFSDSGTITEESALLRFNAVNLRRCHERPEGMSSGVLALTGFNGDKVMTALEIINAGLGIQRESFKLPEDYEHSDFSNIVLNTVLSYFSDTSHSNRCR